MQGYGQMKYHDGSEYVGHWENDCRNGHGTIRTFFGGDGTLETVYVGNWQNDQKHGYGVQDFVVRFYKNSLLSPCFHVFLLFVSVMYSTWMHCSFSVFYCMFI